MATQSQMREAPARAATLPTAAADVDRSPSSSASYVQSASDVWIVMPSANPRGGAEEALMQLARHRASAAIVRLTVVFLESGSLVEFVRALGVNTCVLTVGRLRHGFQYIRCIQKLTVLLRQHRPNVLLCWMMKAHLYGGVAAALAGVPAVYFQHGVPDGSLLDFVSRLVPAAGGVACSRYVANLEQTHTNRPVLGLQMGVDLDRFDPGELASIAEQKEALGFKPDQPLVGMVGRLQRWKGMHVYLDAFARTLHTHPQLQGVIVGGRHELEPEYELFVLAELKRHALEDRVRMVGSQRNVPEWMQAMNIVVHASDREPFGMVVLEAMALGKPVVASKPGGPEEIIRDGVDGVLVAFGDSEALAQAIRSYLDYPDFARQCGESARERAGGFSAEIYARRVGQALRMLVSS